MAYVDVTMSMLPPDSSQVANRRAMILFALIAQYFLKIVNPLYYVAVYMGVYLGYNCLKWIRP